jgi:hypothetical protein
MTPAQCGGRHRVATRRSPRLLQYPDTPLRRQELQWKTRRASRAATTNAPSPADRAPAGRRHAGAVDPPAVVQRAGPTCGASGRAAPSRGVRARAEGRSPVRAAVAVVPTRARVPAGVDPTRQGREPGDQDPESPSAGVRVAGPTPEEREDAAVPSCAVGDAVPSPCAAGPADRPAREREEVAGAGPHRAATSERRAIPTNATPRAAASNIRARGTARAAHRSRSRRRSALRSVACAGPAANRRRR